MSAYVNFDQTMVYNNYYTMVWSMVFCKKLMESISVKTSHQKREQSGAYSALSFVQCTRGVNGPQTVTSILVKTLDLYMVFGQKHESEWCNAFRQESKPVYFMQMHISRGAEQHKFQLHSTFQRGVKGPQRMTSISVKTPDCKSMVFGLKLKIFT